jgi:hypothetical protein
VCIWKTATGFCDTIVEMLQGITYGVSQVIFCSDGALSVRCSCVALALCQREHSFQHSPDLPITRFDVRRLFRALLLHQVSHITAVPSLIASLLTLEESCCPQLLPLARDTPTASCALADTPTASCALQPSTSSCLFHSLEVIASSGEPLHCNLVERLRTLLLRHSDATLSLVNVYGCAETTADACCMQLQLPRDSCADGWGAVVPLGKALQGSCVGVLRPSSRGLPRMRGRHSPGCGCAR